MVHVACVMDSHNQARCKGMKHDQVSSGTTNSDTVTLLVVHMSQGVTGRFQYDLCPVQHGMSWLSTRQPDSPLSVDQLSWAWNDIMRATSPP